MVNNRIWTAEAPRRALITGASGGIGEAFARLLAEEGWQIAIVARREEELNRVAGVLRARQQAEVLPIPLDLTGKDAGARLQAALEARGFSPDVLINNAGAGLAGCAADLPLERQLAMIDLNVRAATELALRFLPAMADRGRGGVLNVASLAAFMPGPHMAVYFASKAYLLSFSEALAEEMAPRGLTVSAFCPGPVRTGFQHAAGMESALLSRLSPMMKPAAAARAAWQGFKEGRVIITPGMASTLTALSLRLVPRALARKAAARLLKPRPPRRRREKGMEKEQAAPAPAAQEGEGAQSPASRAGEKGEGAEKTCP